MHISWISIDRRLIQKNIHPSIRPSVRPSIHPSYHPSYLYVQSMCFSVCLSVFLSTYLFIYLPTCVVCVYINDMLGSLATFCGAGQAARSSFHEPDHLRSSRVAPAVISWRIWSPWLASTKLALCATLGMPGWLTSLSLSPYGCYKDSGLETVLVPSNIARLSLILISVLLDSWCVCHDVPSFMTNKETAGSFPRSTTLITCRIIPLNKRSISRVSKSPQT